MLLIFIAHMTITMGMNVTNCVLYLHVQCYLISNTYIYLVHTKSTYRAGDAASSVEVCFWYPVFFSFVVGIVHQIVTTVHY